MKCRTARLPVPTVPAKPMAEVPSPMLFPAFGQISVPDLLNALGANVARAVHSLKISIALPESAVPMDRNGSGQPGTRKRPFRRVQIQVFSRYSGGAFLLCGQICTEIRHVFQAILRDHTHPEPGRTFQGPVGNESCSPGATQLEGISVIDLMEPKVRLIVPGVFKKTPAFLPTECLSASTSSRAVALLSQTQPE